jgi:hypothetical protein
MHRKALIHAAIYGATVTGIAYLLSFGSLVAFIAMMAAIGIAIRVWAWRYRARHGLPRPTDTHTPPLRGRHRASPSRFNDRPRTVRGGRGYSALLGTYSASTPKRK